MAQRRILTSSTLKEFTGCRQRHNYRYTQRLEPKARPMPLDFGSLWHNLLEAFWLGMRTPADFERKIEEWRSDFERRVRAEPALYDEAGIAIDDAMEIVALAGGMIHGYLERWGADSKRFEVLLVEHPFRFPMHVPCRFCKGKRCGKGKGTGTGRKSPTWDWSGKIDLLVRDRDMRDSIWLMEHKTTSETDPDAYMAKLALDTQHRGYLWAARQICAKRKWKMPAGVIYNVARKKLPAVPQTTQCKSCKGEGQRRAEPRSRTDLSMARCQECAGTGVGGISKAKNTDTTVALFEAALSKQPHLPRADYQDLIDTLGKRGDRFFWRRHAYVSDDAVTDWQVHSMAVAKEIGACERGAGTIHRNEGACFSFGRRCPFWRLCIEDDPMARNNFTVRENELPEMDTPQGDEA